MNKLTRGAVEFGVVLILILSSHLGAQTWQYLGGERSVNVSTQLAVASGTTFYLGTKEGEILKSTNAGQSWSKLGFSFADFVTCESTNPSVVYAGLSQDVGVIQTSTDGGSTWFDINTNLTDSKVSCLAISPFASNDLLAGTL